MDAQATQADQPSARALTRRPAAEAQGPPFGLVVRHQGIAVGARQGAVLQKTHHPRIGMQNGEPVGVGPGDRPQVESLGDDMVTVQDESLPVPPANL